VLVRRVKTLGFRNLADGEVVLADGITLVHGANGAGKTNLLEALFVALAGRSPRTRTDRESIAFGQPLARVEVDVEERPAGEHRTFLFAVVRHGERRHALDGNAVSPADAELRPPLSLFMPDRLALIKGPPAARRAHLDRFCAALWPARAEARRRYARALGQRNALLGRIRAGAGAMETLDAWDRELASAGVELIAIRAEAAERLGDPFTQAADDLGLAGPAGLRYRPRSEAASAEELTSELAGRHELDLQRGFTTHGPHLDELSVSLAERSLRRYGSQGQQRMGLLALLFAEREALIAEARPRPLMLLDDVTSELDQARRRALCDRLEAGGGQAVITATAAEELPARCARRELALREGRVIAVAGEEARAA
jgi:DNA replication and repair protein RecF